MTIKTRFPSLPDVELDALRERQRGAVVDGVGGAAHVGLPGIGAGFAAAAGFLLAAEGAADLGAGRADVDVGDAAVGAGRREEALGLAQVEGEDRRRQALRRRRSAARSPRRSRRSASRRGSARRSRAAPGPPAPASRTAPGARSRRPRRRSRRRARRRAPCRRRRAPRRARAACSRTRAASISGPTSVPASRGSPTRDRGVGLAEPRARGRRRRCRARSGGAASCSAGRRCPWRRRRWRAAPDRGRPRARRSRRCCRRARGGRGRSAPASLGPTARPIAVEPVAETSGDLRVVDQRLADVAAADQHARRGLPARRRTGACARSTSGLRRERRERRLLRRLPDHGVAADERQRRVPRPHRDREVEGRDDAARRRADARSPSSGGRRARWRWSGRRAGATGRRRSRRCRSSPALRRGPRRRSCRLRA